MVAANAVRVRVPATSANLGPGYDAFGLALDLYDDVEVRRTDSGLTWDDDSRGSSAARHGESSLLVRAIRSGMAGTSSAAPNSAGTHSTGSNAGLHVGYVNRIPSGRGLGSSAAAVVAGVLAGRALAGLPADPSSPEVLQLATELEGHPDNVAACLLGGATVAWYDGGAARAARLEPAAALRAVVFVAEGKLATAKARVLLPGTVPHADAAHAAGRAGLLAAALTLRLDLLFPATEDRLHQPYRAEAMPASAALVQRLRAAGIAAVVSGAGPSVLALGTEADLGHVTALAGTGFTAHSVQIERGGAMVEAVAVR